MEVTGSQEGRLVDRQAFGQSFYFHMRLTADSITITLRRGGGAGGGMCDPCGSQFVRPGHPKLPNLCRLDGNVGSGPLRKWLSPTAGGD